jgi:imidazolonepropionase-like amidohydrolase
MRTCTTLLAIALIALTSLTSSAHDLVPGAPQTKPIALTNGIVHTVDGDVLQRATVVFEKGRITAIGTDIVVPDGSTVINCAGKHVYPGFIAPFSTIGLVEIDAVRSTQDQSEVGEFNPNARAEVAYNPDSEIIPTVRVNGVLLANVVPQGGGITGMSSLMRLDGWTREDIAVKPVSAFHVQWPTLSVSTAPWIRQSADEQRRAADSAVQRLYDTFTAARAYSRAARSGDTALRDIRYEAMRRIFEQDVPVIISAGSRKQIESALDFKKHFGIRVILNGAQDARSCMDQIAKAGVSVIIPRVHSLPAHDEDPYDSPFTMARDMEAAGIRWAFTDGGSWQQRNLPFCAGTAMAFGLSEAAAERGLTLSPATMFGVEAQYGSITVGKSATLFVSAGPALDALTNKLEVAFIDGRMVDLDNRHEQLSRKYRQRYAK